MSVSRRSFFGLIGVWSFLFDRARAATPAQNYELDRFPIAGFRYHDGPKWLARISPGDAVVLQAEPENPYDAGAIRLEWTGRHLGYVPQFRNGLLGRLLSQGALLHGQITVVSRTAESWQAVEVAVFLTNRQGGTA